MKLKRYEIEQELNWIEEEIRKGFLKEEIFKKFQEQFDYCERTFERRWVEATTGKCQTKSNRAYTKKHSNHQGKCYFCESKESILHHSSYFPERTIPLCYSCHNKLHRIIKQYHTDIKVKDKLFYRLKKIIENYNLCCDVKSEEN